VKTFTINGKDYRLPDHLSDFQQAMYVHLIDWKWRYITTEPGEARGHEYDAVLPDSCVREGNSPLLYPGVVEAFAQHRAKNDLRLHQYYYHMASSQAANVNLFLPILHHRNASAILRALKPDLAELAKAQLDNGYCLEFWGDNLAGRDIGPGYRGPLRDKSKMAGTDADIAIAYRDHRGDLCLWLIEHKLTEKEFTACGGFKSKGRQARHDCNRSFADILGNKQLCYYHDVCKYRYWDITDASRSVFVNPARHPHCPFRGGMNQLWRNQVLALAIEQDSERPFRHTSFSVVRHPGNTSLDATLGAYRDLLGNNPRFSVLTSAEVVQAAQAFGDASLSEWIAWYRELYML
jgi:hypothetical protein